jgi:hypothetical protein
VPDSEVWQPLFVVFAGSEAANAFYGGRIDKIEQMLSVFGPGLALGGLDGLAEVLAGAEEESEELFKFCALSGGEALATEADDVEPCDAIDALGAAEVRDVFAEGAVALDDAGVADAEELVKHSTAADEAAVADVDVTSKEGGIGDDVAGAELDVMTEMTADHKKVVRAEAGEAAGAAAAVDGDMFAQGAAGTDADSAFGIGIKAEVLRGRADDGSAADFTILAEVDLADDLAVGEEATTGADDCGAIDDDVGADLAGGIDLSGWINDGSGVRHEGKDGVGQAREGRLRGSCSRGWSEFVRADR